MDKIYSSIKRSLNQKGQNVALLSLGLLLLFISAWLVLVYLEYYQDRFYPTTYVDDINISGLKIEEAKTKIQDSLKNEFSSDNNSLVLFYKDDKIETKLSELGIKDNLETVLNNNFEESHGKRGFEKVKQLVDNHLYPDRNYVQLDYKTEKVQVVVDELKNKIDVAGEKPVITLTNKVITVAPGKTSNELLADETLQVVHKQILSKNLRDLKKEDLSVEVVVGHQISALDQLQVEMSKSRAEKMIDKKLTLNYEYQKIELTDKDLINFLALPDGIDQEKLNAFIDGLKKQIDRPSSDASLAYDKETLKVTEFTPDKNGLEVNAVALKKIVEDFLSATENGAETDNSFALPMKNTPAATNLEKTNDLGIKEVVGFGESWYDHSIPNRVYNVDIATSHITNHIVKPGEEFSFNKAIGEVSDRTGYRNAYIIEGGQTKLAPGGGVCQVSSTLFRSLLNAGVKITRRLPHAYRVSYYEIGNEPGFDATVYSGETDLRFMNDTPAHVLISCQSNSEELYMFCKLYGTSDGRSTEIVNYKKWGATGPLPTVYIPDTSLRPGQLKQIDWAAGGIKSEFTNVIRDKNGEVVREDYYKSNYRSWAAKYLRGI